MGGRLTPSQRALLAQMQADNAAAGPPFTEGKHWQWVNDAFRVWLERDGIGTVEEQLYNHHFSSFPPGHVTYYHIACWLLYNAVKRKDRWGVLPQVETTLPEGSSRRIKIGGQPLSWDALISLDTLLSIAAVWLDVLTAPVVVGDLGAGWGRIGMALKQVNPAATYMVFDLPEALLISSDYLPRATNVRSSVHGYDDTGGRDWAAADLRDRGLWFCAARELARLPDRALDCLISVASFQEMPLADTQAYFTIIDRVVQDVFYLFQQQPRTPDAYAPLPHWRPLLHRPAAWSPRYFEAAYEVQP